MVVKSLSEILIFFKKRETNVKNLDKLNIDDSVYINFISHYKAIQVNPDIDLFNYERCIKENDYIKENYLNVYENYLIIGRSGQGDEWFINRNTLKIFFYDHNKGEYTEEGFSNMNITFEKFLQLAFLMRELEEKLDEDESLEDDISFQNTFKELVNSISNNLYKNYPYNYF